METAFENQTSVGVGFANLVDAFQAGREAAQMAKLELLDRAHIDLILALGPDSIHFQDFVEGVRLVCGEEKLIGIPASKVFYHSPVPPDSSMVIMLASKQNQFEISCAHSDANLLPAVTSLFTEFRRIRGNNRHQFDHHGVLFFENTKQGLGILPTQLMAADAGLDSWIVGVTPRSRETDILMCRDNTLPKGLVALECLTNSPIGLGVVNLRSFKNQPHIIREALRIALRDAVLQMEGADPAFSLVFMDLDPETISPQDFQHVFQGNTIPAKSFPLFGICTQSQTFRPQHHSSLAPTECVFCVVIPQ